MLKIIQQQQRNYKLLSHTVNLFLLRSIKMYFEKVSLAVLQSAVGAIAASDVSVKVFEAQE